MVVLATAVLGAFVWVLNRNLLHKWKSGTTNAPVDSTFMYFWVTLFVMAFLGLWMAVTMRPWEFANHCQTTSPMQWGAMVLTGFLVFLSASLMYWVLRQPQGTVSFVGPLSMAAGVATVFVAGLVFFPADQPATPKGKGLLYGGVGAVLLGIALMGSFALESEAGGAKNG